MQGHLLGRRSLASIFVLLSVLQSLAQPVFADEIAAQQPQAAQTPTPAPTPEPPLAVVDKTADSAETDDVEEIDLGDNQAEADAKKDFTGVIRQSKPYTCGPASLATLKTQLGDDTSEADVLQYIPDLSEEKGVSLLALKSLLRSSIPASF